MLVLYKYNLNATHLFTVCGDWGRCGICVSSEIGSREMLQVNLCCWLRMKGTDSPQSNNHHLSDPIFFTEQPNGVILVLQECSRVE